MSSLYRCKVRVAYKPYDYDKLIVFDERQVVEAEVDLKWDHSAILGNTDAMSNTPAFVSSLSNSTCRVTISDPYLTGIAWPLLWDSASLYLNPENSAKQGLLIRPCDDNEDPIRDVCRRYPDINSEGQPYKGGYDKYPHLLISMWYDVGGTKFGTDFFFRVVNMSITHGTNYPTVQMLGLESRAIIFNQSLANYGFDEGTTFEQGIEKVIKDYGYSPSFCATDYSKNKYVQPSATRESGLTPHEIIKRRLNAVGGNILTMPTREWQDKVSICTRAEVNQGCKVFYLGKGLYESYTIDGVPNSQYASNLENNPGNGASINNNAIYTHPIFESDEYVLSDTMFKKLRETRLKAVKKNPFPEQFKELDKRFDGNQATSGLHWQGTGPKVRNIRGDKINFYGISPNGTNSIAYLDGLVKIADESSGTVQILTKYFLFACGKIKGENKSKCFSGPIYQEVNNLTKLSVTKSKQFDVKTYVRMGQVVGTSTKEKPDFVRFFINGPGTEVITIPAEIVYKYAIPEDGLNDKEFSEYVGERITSNSSGTVGSSGLSTPANLGSFPATTSKNAPKVLLMAGHYDSQVSESGANGNEYVGNKYALDWIRENAASYGIANIFEYYIPPSTDIKSGKDRGSQYSKTATAVKQGKHVIELHHDAGDSTGRSGIIPPSEGKTRYPLDVALSKVYGSYGVKWRGGDLGIPSRGGTILEIAAYTPENRARALSANKAVRDAYYKQALDPFMKAVYIEYSKNGQTTTPNPSNVTGSAPSSSSGGGPLTVGLVGSTGSSTGPHLHAEFLCNGIRCFGNAKPITVKDIENYVLVGGKKPSELVVFSPFGPRSLGFHYGIDLVGNGYDINRKQVSITGGAVVLSPLTGCQVENEYGNICGDGFGNSVIIETPDKKQIILAHLAPGTVNPSAIRGRSGGNGSSGSNKYNTGMMTGPSAQGLFISTSFRGVPRALRIIPGRTILSFVTEYDQWINEGKPRNIDPGVWIPDRFSNFFIKGCTLKWRGDLRVDVRGVLDWGVRKIEVPKFNDYLAEYQKDTATVTKDYYGYIRSAGDLCYTVSGKNSCETVCKEVQEIERFLNSNKEAGENSPDMSTSFGQSNCRYNGSQFASKADVINKIMGALGSAGITNRIAVSGVLGNVAQESGFDPLIHVNNPGAGCSGTPAYGLFQWCFTRKTKIMTKEFCGPGNGNLQCQLSYLLWELKNDYKRAISSVNSATTPEQAAAAWNADFEVGQDVDKRQRYAKQIYENLKCSKP